MTTKSLARRLRRRDFWEGQRPYSKQSRITNDFGIPIEKRCCVRSYRRYLRAAGIYDPKFFYDDRVRGAVNSIRDANDRYKEFQEASMGYKTAYVKERK